MVYLCRTFGGSAPPAPATTRVDTQPGELLYPQLSDPGAAAKMDEYLHWHHQNTRLIAARMMAPHIRPDIAKKMIQAKLGKDAGDTQDLVRAFVTKNAATIQNRILPVFEKKFLASGGGGLQLRF